MIVEDNHLQRDLKDLEGLWSVLQNKNCLRGWEALKVWQEAKQHKDIEQLLLPNSWKKETGSDTRSLSGHLGPDSFHMKLLRHRNQ